MPDNVKIIFPTYNGIHIQLGMQQNLAVKIRPRKYIAQRINDATSASH